MVLIKWPKPKIEMVQEQKTIKDILSSTCLDSLARKASDLNGWGHEFSTHLVNILLLDLLQLLPIIFCVFVKKLGCATRFKSSDLTDHSIVTQKGQRLVLVILDGTFCEVDSCVKSYESFSIFGNITQSLTIWELSHGKWFTYARFIFTASLTVVKPDHTSCWEYS